MNLARLEQDVINICREVGKFIRAESQAFDRSRIEFKMGFNNLVSYVDKEAELRLVESLKGLLPESGMVAEEGTGRKVPDGLNWIIDPLDGTTNFLHGLPPFAISVALAEGNSIRLGVVYEITRDECFHAYAGSPSFCNGSEIRVSTITHLNESLLATGFPYYHQDKREVYLEIIKEFLERTHGIRRLGSAAVDLAYVACGRMEGFFEYNLNAWDVAAGTFIVQQAGGKVTDFRGGGNYLYGGELVAAGLVHAEMLNVIQSLWYPQKK